MKSDRQQSDDLMQVAFDKEHGMDVTIECRECNVKVVLVVVDGQSDIYSCQCGRHIRVDNFER